MISEEVAVYCVECEMWLRSDSQMERHKIGKKHKKNIARKAKAVYCEDCDLCLIGPTQWETHEMVQRKTTQN
tara:strand:- start:170 stop:385 length:216 start_codon:yes stop_codon:yes gene_type:complete